MLAVRGVLAARLRGLRLDLGRERRLKRWSAKPSAIVAVEYAADDRCVRETGRGAGTGAEDGSLSVALTVEAAAALAVVAMVVAAVAVVVEVCLPPGDGTGELGANGAALGFVTAVTAAVESTDRKSTV